MGIDGPTFVPKSGYFFINLGQGLSSKVDFLLIFSKFYELAFLTMLAFSNKKPTFILVSGF